MTGSLTLLQQTAADTHVHTDTFHFWAFRLTNKTSLGIEMNENAITLFQLIAKIKTHSNDKNYNNCTH